MAAVTTYSAHNNITRVFVLGQNTIMVHQLKLWEDRIDWFIKENNLSAALSLAYTFFIDDAKAVVGLPRKRADRQICVGK